MEHKYLTKSQKYGKHTDKLTFKDSSSDDQMDTSSDINDEKEDIIEKYNIITDKNNTELLQLFETIKRKCDIIKTSNKNNYIQNNEKTTVSDVLAPIYGVSETQSEYKPWKHPLHMLLTSFILLDKHASLQTVNNVLQLFKIIKQNKIDVWSAKIPNDYNALKSIVNEALPTKLPIGK